MDGFLEKFFGARVKNGLFIKKRCNRAVRYVKLLYEALPRILIEIVDEGIKETVEGITLLREIDTLSRDLDENSLSTVIDSEIFRDYRNYFISTTDNNRDSGELAKFWLTFIDITTFLLNTIYATRSGNFDLLIESLWEMIPFTFAYNRIHYARYLTVMVAEMTNLEFTNKGTMMSYQNKWMECKPAPGEVNKCITLSLIQTKIFTVLILWIFFLIH